MRSITRFGAASWVADQCLHTIAYVSLCLTSPPRAKTWIDRIGSLYPTIKTADEARRMASNLGAQGTCLSRSLAVAARTPGSNIVIGIPDSQGLQRDYPASRQTFGAHAWVEMSDGRIGYDTDSPWVELGRM